MTDGYPPRFSTQDTTSGRLTGKRPVKSQINTTTMLPIYTTEVDPATNLSTTTWTYATPRNNVPLLDSVKEATNTSNKLGVCNPFYVDRDEKDNKPFIW